MISAAGSMLLGLFGLAALLAGARLLRGPSLPDRVVAVDLLSAVAVAVCALAAVVHDQPAYLDVSLGIALISFVGTVAFARYVEGRGRR